MNTKEMAVYSMSAGFEVLNVKELCYPWNEDKAEAMPKATWWFVKTPRGWIEIGWWEWPFWINWRDTGLEGATLTEDPAVVKGPSYVMPRSAEQGFECLKTLASLLQ